MKHKTNLTYMPKRIDKLIMNSKILWMNSESKFRSGVN